MAKIKKYPLVSIITPVYNRAELLEETILSILGQDYPNFEYIVLNDGSKDESLAVMKKYRHKIIIRSHQNMGEAKTVNKGFKLAKGEIVAVINSDDPLYPGAIATAVGFLQKHSGIAVAYPDWDYINENSQLLRHVKVPKYDFLSMVGEHKCFVGPGTFFRRAVLDSVGGRDPALRYVGDFDFWLRLGLKVKFARIPQTLATFRVHQNSVSIAAQSDEMAAEDIKLINKFYGLPNLSKKILAIKNQALSSAHFHAAQVCGKNKKLALYHFYQSFILFPSSIFNLDKLKAILYTLFLKK